MLTVWLKQRNVQVADKSVALCESITATGSSQKHNAIVTYLILRERRQRAYGTETTSCISFLSHTRPVQVFRTPNCLRFDSLAIQFVHLWNEIARNSLKM